jgi:hypothetical protein
MPLNLFERVRHWKQDCTLEKKDEQLVQICDHCSTRYIVGISTMKYVTDESCVGLNNWLRWVVMATIEEIKVSD